MKKFAKTASVLAALALLFGAVSCKDNDDPDVVEESKTPVAVESVTIAGDSEVVVGQTITLTATVTPANATVASDGTVKGVAAGEVTITAKAGETTATKTITVKEASIEQPGGGDEPGAGVTAVWSFATQPADFPLSDASDKAVTDFDLPVASGTGATLTATGRWKWASSYLQAQASSGATVADAATWKTTSGGKWLTLTLTAKANVTIKYAGAGILDAKRFVAVLDETNAVLWGTDAAGIDTTEVEKVLELEAGTYTIAMNGSRVYSISCN